MVIASRFILSCSVLLLAGCTQVPTDFFARAEPVEVFDCKRMSAPNGPDTRGAGTIDPMGCSFLAQGKASFRRGDYGLAERNYRKAVEVFSKAPGQARTNYLEALLGLAASYDAMKRFDLADQIYKAIGDMAPDSVQYNNNYGYSLMLRGQPELAKPYLDKAQQLAPANMTVQNNSKIR